ncbi:MAG: SRPBCC domain-containing protein [Flavobacteriales bacterium]|nr:SRPBCC domain-containing protein [Flavobacteriales bacterium]
MMGVEPVAQPARALKRAVKERYQAEFYMRSTPNVLFELISTPSGFSEWFCDDVNVRGDEFAFEWGGEVQTALCIGRRAGELMRFRWLEDEDPGAYFELRIRIDPMTNDVALVVTDHAWPQDLESARQLWASQVAHLMRVIGS